MLAGLGHGTIGRRHYQDGTVHLRGTGDHVLYVVGVAGAVHVRIVPLRGLILHVRRVDRDTTGLLFRRLVDFVVAHRLRFALLGQRHGDGCSQRRLAMVHVSDRADVYMRLCSFIMLLSHGNYLLALRDTAGASPLYSGD